MSWTKEWLNVFFNDEKELNVGGQQDWDCYWCDIYKEARELFSANNKEGVHSWCGENFLIMGRPIPVLKRLQFSENYQKSFEAQLLSLKRIAR